MFGMGTGVAPPLLPTGNQDARGKNIDARNMLFVEDAIFSLPLSSCFLFSEDCIAVQISDQVLDRLVPGPLKALLPLHSRPINQVIFLGSYPRTQLFLTFDTSIIDRKS